MSGRIEPRVVDPVGVVDVGFASVVIDALLLLLVDVVDVVRVVGPESEFEFHVIGGPSCCWSAGMMLKLGLLRLPPGQGRPTSWTLRWQAASLVRLYFRGTRAEPVAGTDLLISGWLVSLRGSEIVGSVG